MKFDLSGLSRRRSAKFALVMLTAVVVITLVTFTVRAWRKKTSFTAKQNGSAAQLTLAADVNYVQRVRLRPRLHHLLNSIGDRLEKPGNERRVMIGTLRRQNDSQLMPFRLYLELPYHMRLEEQGAQPRVTGFDGSSGWALGSILSDADQNMIETLIFDSADHFFLGQTQGLANRALGSRFRLDDGTDANYAGPFYDIYQVMDRLGTGSTVRQQPKLFYFNSDTQLLERVRYRIERNGAAVNVETRITDWKRVNNQRVPCTITRLEDDKPALTITIASTVIGPRVADGAFNNPQGR